jgi:hypothetical protein
MGEKAHSPIAIPLVQEQATQVRKLVELFAQHPLNNGDVSGEPSINQG